MRTLDEENTRLRNVVIESNEEIFTLKAVAVAVEAELKYETDQQLAKMESELKFRVSDIFSQLSLLPIIFSSFLRFIYRAKK